MKAPPLALLVGVSLLLGAALARAHPLAPALLELREHGSGHPFGLIEFDSVTDGMALTQWLAVLATSERDRLFVTAASERSLWAKYEPLFQAVMSSIRRA